MQSLQRQLANGNFRSARSLHSHIFDHALGAFHGYCVLLGRLIARSREDSVDVLLSVLLLDHALLVAKVSGPCLSYQPLGPDVFTSSHIQSYIITIIVLIWNCISALCHRLRHTFGNLTNNLQKQVSQKIIQLQLAVISKVISKNYKSRTFIGQSPVYPQVIGLHLSNDYSLVLISWLYIMEHLIFI